MVKSESGNIKSKKWISFLEEFARLFYLWIFFMATLMLFRGVLIYVYNEKISDAVTGLDYINTILMGIRFDSHAIMMFLIVPFLANVFIHTVNRDRIVGFIRLAFSYIFLFVSLLLSVITIPYFKEYNSQFNHFLFMGIYDDKAAVARTIYSQYHPIQSLLLFVVLLYVSIRIVRYISSKKPNIQFIARYQLPYQKIIIGLVILALTVVALRGSAGHRPAFRKWAYISGDEFLNKTIINPIRSLMYAYKDYTKLQSGNQNNPYKVTSSINTNKQTSGHGIGLPNHIVMVVMESYDSWPLQDKYKNLHLTDKLSSIASKGTHFKKFLPAANSTFNSLGAVISGLPYSGTNISLKKSFGGAEETSIFQQMEKLGYDTYFFYGGFSSWQNIGNFVKNQGANHILSGANIGGKTKTGVWGSDDDQLFGLIEKTLEKKNKTFSIVMTTSYHPPFTLNLKKYGYPYESYKDFPEEYKKIYDGSVDANILGHLWFSDLALGNFVEKFESKSPDTLFVFTGDHYGRRYFNGKPNLYELSSVPFIIYGRGAKSLNKYVDFAGSHLDIFPTLVELISPREFSYKSFGTPMQEKNRSSIAIGYQKIISNKKVRSVKTDNFCYIYDYSIDASSKEHDPTICLKNRYDNYMGNAWGATISDSNNSR